MTSKIFSLEIFIDRIRLAAGEKCLFPSSILKFLNYEPAYIGSIDSKLKENLRKLIDPNQTLQINELKDLEGNFIIRKGKSILFEAETVSLMGALNSLPVYILIVDDYYSPSHLTAVAAINTSSLMNNLAKKISSQSCTASESTIGKFPLVNLMGETIGGIVLSLKLIFVGDNISRHVHAEQELIVRSVPKEPRQTSNKSVGEQLASFMHTGDDSDSAPSKVVVRNFGCQVNEKRSILIQVAPKVPENLGHDRSARIGLSIDPNDPLLEAPPPLIYNSRYENDGDLYEDDYRLQAAQKSIIEDLPLLTQKFSSEKAPSKLQNKKTPILNALFSELKELKGDDSLEDVVLEVAPKSIQRSKSSEPTPTTKVVNPKEFIRRMSKPKMRPPPPAGLVPKNLGWIRTEPQFAGPKKSSLEYKLTKTQIRRIELRNPRLHDRMVTQTAKPPKMDSRKEQPQKFDVRYNDGDNTATSYSEPAPKERHPLVPPLFNPGTSISVPSFTQTDPSSSLPQRHRDHDIDDGSQRLPPRSPDRQRNNNQPTMSYETNDTVEEADNLLNLNPVQSNRSPQMTIRSQTMPINDDDQSEDEYESEEDRRCQEYSDDLNSSFSSSNGPRSPSRRFSNVSQVSQTSEWRTEYSRGSSMSQNYLNKNDSPSESPDLGTYRSPPKSPVKARRSLLAQGVAPGGRFSDLSSSRNLKSSGSFVASFDESADRSIYSTSASGDAIAQRDLEGTVRSRDQYEGPLSQLRPSSAGGDVTSITKVTKFDRSVAPGNFLATNYMASTVASMQTDDSQMLTSDSFY